MTEEEKEIHQRGRALDAGVRQLAHRIGQVHAAWVRENPDNTERAIVTHAVFHALAREFDVRPYINRESALTALAKYVDGLKFQTVKTEDVSTGTKVGHA